VKGNKYEHKVTKPHEQYLVLLCVLVSLWLLPFMQSKSDLILARSCLAMIRTELGTREPSLIVLLRYAKVAGLSMESLVDACLDLPVMVRT
jgi:hypothetical protein